MHRYLIKGLAAASLLTLTVPAHAAVYDFKYASGAQRIPALTGVGDEIRLEVVENLATPDNDVLFTFSSFIAEPAAVLVRFWFDLGSHNAMISDMAVHNQAIGVNIVKHTTPATHPYAPGINPEYQFGLSPRYPFDSDIYGIHPFGDYVTISAQLNTGYSYADLIDAMNEGVTTGTQTTGIRAATMAYHLLGPRIDPRVTLMDDAGYVTNSLLPVPEPQTWAMLLAGLGLVGVMARRAAR